MNQILIVKRFLEQTTLLYESLSPVQSSLLVKIREVCRPEVVMPFRSEISNTIEDDATYASKPLDLRNQRTFAVKVELLCHSRLTVF
jgi:DNA mismatch repair protein MSH4